MQTYKSKYRITDCENNIAMEIYLSKEEYLLLKSFFNKFEKAMHNFCFENIEGNTY